MYIASNRRSSLTIAIVCATVWTSAALGEVVERRGPADPRGVVEIGNVSGTVHVAGWDKPEIEIRGELGSDVERLDFTREGERTVIKVVLPRNSSDSESDLTIRVPQESRLAINTVSADQIVEGMKSAQRLQSVSGDIITHVWSSEFEVMTVDGDITAKARSAKGHEVSTKVRITTVSGDLILTDIGGDLDINTVSGDMQITAPSLSRAHIQSTNGDLQLSGKLARDARLEAESINGGVMLELEGTINAEFDLESFNGEIENCFGPKAKRSRERGPGTELRFKEGDGSAQVRVKTLNGDIVICK